MIFASETQIIWPFKHSAGTTGLLGSAFSAVVMCNGEVRGNVVTVTEASGGYYAWDFIPDQEGLWLIDVWETATPAVRYGTSGPIQVDDFETRICGKDFTEEKDALFNIKRLLQLNYSAGQNIASWRGFRSGT